MTKMEKNLPARLGQHCWRMKQEQTIFQWPILAQAMQA
jgi:hypothetical protein